MNVESRKYITEEKIESYDTDISGSFNQINRKRRYEKVHMLLRKGTENQFTDNLNACRKGKNIVTDVISKTGGLLAIMTCSNFIVHLSEFVHLESPTAVILRYYESMTNNEICLEYFRRMLLVFGFDCMCNIYKRLLRSFSGKMEYYDVVKF